MHFLLVVPRLNRQIELKKWWKTKLYRGNIVTQFQIILSYSCFICLLLCNMILHINPFFIAIMVLGHLVYVFWSAFLALAFRFRIIPLSPTKKQQQKKHMHIVQYQCSKHLKICINSISFAGSERTVEQYTCTNSNITIMELNKKNKKRFVQLYTPYLEKCRHPGAKNDARRQK